MVTRFANAGNVGANVWGWAEKIVSLDLNKKGSDWQVAVDSVLASYTNRMNLACGDDMTINTSGASTSSSSSQPTALQTAAALAVGVAFPGTGNQPVENPYEDQSLYMEIQSMSELWDYNTAHQVVQAGLSNTATTQNAFLTSSQMDNMQRAYKRGTKVFVIRDSGRCYIIPVQTMTDAQSSLVAQKFANCISK